MNIIKSLLCAALLSCFVLTSNASTHSFMKDNDLWKQDVIMKSLQFEEDFNKVIALGLKFYKPYADKNKEKLIVNALWEDSTVNANVTRTGKKVIINMYGGLARRPEVSIEGFALVLCHELGHAYGGTPYVSPWQKLAAEGQADWYGAGECLMQVLTELEEQTYETTEFTKITCGEDVKCLRALYGAQGLANLLANLSEEKLPDYQTPDLTIVEKTELSYPATTQCRLDSYFAGITKHDRPLCWFNPADPEGLESQTSEVQELVLQ